MYRYSECVWDFPHRITGDGYQRLMNFFSMFPQEQFEDVKWDEEDVDYLLALYHRNHTLYFIADVLERSVYSVHAKVKSLRKHGLLPYRGKIEHMLSEKRQQYIRRHYPQRGIDYCARHLGLKPRSILTYVRQMGFEVDRETRRRIRRAA